MSTTTITSFREDSAGDWIAELACGHSQHVRHRPPWEQRPWVIDAAARAARVGAPMECPSCDRMPALPAGAREYKRTATWDETTIPAGLLKDHSTKAGTWARIVVEEGRLEYELDGPDLVFVLTPTRDGIIPPAVPHRVRPLGAVRFYIAFLEDAGRG